MTDQGREHTSQAGACMFCRSLWRKALLLGVIGCGSAAMTEGTEGNVFCEVGGVRDVRVSVHQFLRGEWHLVGEGVSDYEGFFTLRTPSGLGPCRLTPGEYRITLEPAGDGTWTLPDSWMSIEQTPLRVSVKDGSQPLQIALPTCEWHSTSKN